MEFNYEVFIVEEETIRLELQSPRPEQLGEISSSVKEILDGNTPSDITSGSFVVPDDLTAYQKDAEYITTVRAEFEEQEKNQENVGTVEIKVEPSIEFQVSSLTIPKHDDPEELKKWAEGKLEELLRDLKLRSDLKYKKKFMFEFRNT